LIPLLFFIDLGYGILDFGFKEQAISKWQYYYHERNASGCRSDGNQRRSNRHHRRYIDAEGGLSRRGYLKAYTVEAAYSGFEETIKGRIVPGMLADFIVISDDIRKVTARQLLSIKVLQT